MRKLRPRTAGISPPQPQQLCGEGLSLDEPGDYVRVGKTVWMQPGQVERRLHYASLEITGKLSVGHIRHNIFGEELDFMEEALSTSRRGALHVTE